MLRLRTFGRKGWNALVAFLAFVLTVAPLASQAVMAAETPAHHGAAASVDIAHQHFDQHSFIGRHHEVAAEHSHHHGHNHANAAKHSHDGGSPTPQHDPDGGPDSTCCGTYCHLVCSLTAFDAIPFVGHTGTFERSVSAALASVDPDQLQRPPSLLLSV